MKRWCRQILKGLEFLHENSIIHRDIKCDNIFINGSTGDIRIGDLGLSTKMAEARDNKDEVSNTKEEPREVTAFAMTCLGTPEFMAPELYDENYNEMVDVYAFGMTCLEMVTSKTPYHECTSAPQIYKKVCAGELPPELALVRNNNAKAFIEACIQPQATRPTASQLLAHPFLQENEEEDFLEVRVKLKKSSIKEELGRVSESEEDESSDDDDDDDDDVAGDEGIIRNNSTPTNESCDVTSTADSSQVESQKTVQNESCKEDSGDLTAPSPEFASGRTQTPITKSFSPVNSAVQSTGSNAVSNSCLSDPSSQTHPSELPSKSLRDETPPSNDILSAKSNESGCKQKYAPSTKEIEQIIDIEKKSTSKKSLSGGGVGSRVLRVYDEGVFRPRSGSIGAGGSGIRHDHKESLTRSNPIPIPSAAGKDNSATTNISSSNIVLGYSPSAGENFVGVVDLEDKGTNSESLIFRLRVPFGDTFKEVEFEFNLKEDNPNTIVEEMNEAEELVFMRPYAQEIIDSLTPVVDVAKRLSREKAAAKLATQQQSQVGAPDLSLPYDIVLSSEPQHSSILKGTDTNRNHFPIQSNLIEAQNQDEVLAKYSNSPLSEMVIEKVLATPGVCDDRALAALSIAAGDRMQKMNGSPKLTSDSAFQNNASANLMTAPPMTRVLSDNISSRPPFSVMRSGSAPNLQSDDIMGGHESRSRALTGNENSGISSTPIPLPFGDLEPAPEGCEGFALSEDSTEEDRRLYNELITKYNESVAKVEKEYNHVTGNLASQGEKLIENYKREYDKVVNRKNDLTKQLHDMEEKYRVSFFLCFVA